MNMRDIAAEYRLSHWVDIVRDRGVSGMNVREYCKASGIRENVYYYWQRKLRKAASDSLAEQTSISSTGLAVQGFAEVTLAEPPAQATLPEAMEPGQLQLEIGGIRISADSSYPPDKLAALLRELSRP